jgi:hypothetical protein
MAKLVAAGAIFAYWDGCKVRYADPFRIWRELTQDEKVNFDRLMPEIDDAESPAITTAVEHVCKVFAVKRWDEATQTGLTDLQLLHLLGDVLRWTAFVKKKPSRGPTSPTVAADTSSVGQADQPSTPNSSSASTSTETESKPAEPIPSSAPCATC